MQAPPTPYRPQNHVRIVSAASLFDGHDAAINIMRRILQASGAEVIHLGHNRSVAEVVDCAIAEDAQGIALTSYQGGHVEYLKYMVDLLAEAGADIKVFAGGGGTILPVEAADLHAYGVARIYSPDDGRSMGLQGMINDLLKQCDFEPKAPPLAELVERLGARDAQAIAKLITRAECVEGAAAAINALLPAPSGVIPVLGITGTGGSGKSSLVDELVQRFLRGTVDKSIAIISVDPSKRKTGGALLGDRIRMNAIHSERVYMRSLATRQANLALSPHVKSAIAICRAAAFDLVIVETSGIGQSDTEITEHCDVSLYVMTAEYGAASQLEKIDMLDFADIVAINKSDKRGSLDALRDVRKQFRRNHVMFDGADEDLPIHSTVASQFGDPGVDGLYKAVMDALDRKTGTRFESTVEPTRHSLAKQFVVPPERVRYLAEIAEASDRYDAFVEAQCDAASTCYRLLGAIHALEGGVSGDELLPPLEEDGSTDTAALVQRYAELSEGLDPASRGLLQGWPDLVARYRAPEFRYSVRGREMTQPLYTETLSHLKIPRVALPKHKDWGDTLRWQLTENVPGRFPFAAGVFPLKRRGEDPARMFAGEGGAERTNRRFHYVSRGLPAKRLSTAFDSVTLYGEDPARRPDIYGKIGNAGVSIATLDDAKKLYSGFDLVHKSCSVSMTINGPAPMLLGFFLNAAIDQQCERFIHAEGLVGEVKAKIAAKYAAVGMDPPVYSGELPEGNDGLGLLLLGVTGDEVIAPEVYERIKAETLRAVRGTVQADILKEDQAQNTCIFSTEFALKMMGDIQAFFIDQGVRNFYSVSISGYHIAEAGANPITQLAFTLANGFTFIEYYISRGMKIDEFAPNLSFFFSNGVDAEYTVIGRVARRIWSKAVKHVYGGNERSQKLKYHIQTSGRSLHAQEIAFNDIRTTLQALYAIYDNCNSLHTNAYDEAITTPTEESVRRAMAIQHIINKELGLANNENPLQGAFVVDELTELVEQAVLTEFRRLSDRGGVLGAMERMYQRTKIQEESLFYESRKHSGDLPIVGVNTFLGAGGSPTIIPEHVIRSTEQEKQEAIANCAEVRKRNEAVAPKALADLQEAALTHGNVFESLMAASKVCTLGQLSAALYMVGGKYRRSM